MLEEHARIGSAIELVRRGARVAVVCTLTGLSVRPVRELYPQLRGCSPPRGPVHDTGCRMIKTRRQQAHASLFAVLYERFSGDAVCRATAPQPLIAAHDLYLEFVARAGDPPEIDINVAWVIARDLRIGSSRLVPCEQCQIAYLVSENSRVREGCPICSVYARLGESEGRKQAKPRPKRQSRVPC